MPDLWDTNPENVPDTPGEQPAPAASDDDPKEVGSRTAAAASDHLRTS